MDTHSTTPSRARASSERFCRKSNSWSRMPELASAADVVQQLVHQDQRRPVRQHLADHVAGRGDAPRVVFRDRAKRLLPAELPGDFAPRRLPQRLALAAAAVDHVELGSDKDGSRGLRDGVDAGIEQERIDALP